MKSKVKMKAISRFYFFFLLLCVLPVFAQTPAIVSRQQRRLAIEYERLGRYEKALEIYQVLYTANVQDFSAFDGVKRCLIAQRKFDEAITFVETYLVKNDQAHIKADLGNIYFAAGMEKKAKNIWHDVLVHNQMNASAYQFVASAMLSSHLVEDALKTFEAGREGLKDPNLFASEMARIFAARLEYEKAAAEYIKYFKQHPRQISYVERGITNLMAQDAKATKAVLSLLEKTLKNEKSDKKLYALIIHAYMAVGDYETAFGYMKNFVEFVRLQPPANQKGNELFDFANDALQDEAYAVSEKAFRLFFEKYPQSPFLKNAEYSLAQCFQKEGKIDSALAAFQRIIEKPGHSFQAEQSLFQIGVIFLNERFSPKQARTAFEQVLKIKQPESQRTEAMVRIGDCYFAEGNLTDAKAWYQKVFAEASGEEELQIKASFYLAEVALAEDKIEEAIPLFGSVATAEFSQEESEASQLKNDALNWLLLLEDPKIKTDPGLAPYCSIILTEKQHHYDKSLETLSHVVSMVPASKLADRAWQKMAEIYRRQEKYSKAIFALETLLNEYPENFYGDRVKMTIGEIYYQNLMDFKKARQHLEEFLVWYPRSTYIGHVRQMLTSLTKKEAKQDE